MPPKCKFTREEIISCALDMTREHGISSVTARSLGEKLGSSSKPIFSIFQNMEEVQEEIMRAAYEVYSRYLTEDIKSGKYPAYKASGMGYIRFAGEEKELFKLLFMRDRSLEKVPQPDQFEPELVKRIAKSLSISEELARRFHVQMWIYVHGIAVMLATGYLSWNPNDVSLMLTDAYEGIKSRYLREDGPSWK